MKKNITYKQAGVDREKADALVSNIGQMIGRSLRGHESALPSLSVLGGYASLYSFDGKNYTAASTDGVGTKLKLAFETKTYHTVGIDLVAMAVNDLLCVGAKPAFFLDYFATGKLKSEIAKKVLAGIVEGCVQGRLALLGGETAEMPGLYQEGEFDLAGFAVGNVSKENLLPKQNVTPGLDLIGLASTGTHSNGYSLIRKLLPRSGKERKQWVNQFLAPTQIYVNSLYELLFSTSERVGSKAVGPSGIIGLAHITGSGYLNLPRISDQVSYEVELPSLEDIPNVFGWLDKVSGLSFSEQAQTWNLGIGMVMAVEPSKSKLILQHLYSQKMKAWKIGKTIPNEKRRGSQIFLKQMKRSAILTYGKS